MLDSDEGSPVVDLFPCSNDSLADVQKRKYTKSEQYKQRRKHDRFNGMTEEEVRSRTLPDHLAANLDVVIVSCSHVIICYNHRVTFEHFK